MFLKNLLHYFREFFATLLNVEDVFDLIDFSESGNSESKALSPQLNRWGRRWR